jgi:hypothetical protein
MVIAKYPPTPHMEEPCDDIQNERSEKILTAAMSAKKKGMSVPLA